MPAHPPKSPKEREPDPSLDSERESRTAHERRMERDAKRAESSHDLREKD